jgi:hypothetical protein
MPRFSDDGRWVWDYSSSRWIPANKISKASELEELGISNAIVEPGNASTNELNKISGEWNGTQFKVFAITMSILLPGIDYAVLGWIKPRNAKQIWLGIGILHLWTILLATAICAPLALVIWFHGMATVARRADERVAEIGGFTNDIRGRRIKH